MNIESFRFGKLPPKIDYRTLNFGTYLKDDIPAPPPETNLTERVCKNLGHSPQYLFPMFANDQLGNCVIDGTMVHAGHILAGYRASYSGPVITIITNSGRRLTVTPNHAILTPRGFTLARFLNEGDYTVCGSFSEDSTTVDSYFNQPPTLIEKKLTALTRDSASRFKEISYVPVSTDFHGDARFLDSNVDIITTDGLLRGYGYSSHNEPPRKKQIGSASKLQGSLHSDCAPLQADMSSGLSTFGVIGGFNQRPSSVVIHVSPPHRRSLRPISGRNTMLNEIAFGYPSSDIISQAETLKSFTKPITLGKTREIQDNIFAMTIPYSQRGLTSSNCSASRLHPSDECRTTDPDFLRKLISRFTSQISVDKIIEIRNENYVGHVNDLSTEQGWYSANGIITHNCTIAGMAHGVTVYHGMVSQKHIPTQTEVIRIYNHLTGGIDSGLYLLDVIKYWRSTGIEESKIFAYANVSPHNHEHVKQAIAIFGGLFCVSPNTRVLTYDLKWKPAEELKSDDELLAFDEEDPIGKGHGRRYKKATVINNGIHKLDSYRIYLSDGSQLVSSSDHLWLISHREKHRQNWWSTEKIYQYTRKHAEPLLIPRFLPITTKIDSYESGFLSAAFDGEGCIGLHKTGLRDARELRLQFSQNDNLFLKEVKNTLLGFGYYLEERIQKKCHVLRIYGGFQEVMRFLMETRPPRLLSKWSDSDTNLGLKARERIEILNIENIGEQYVSTLQTSSGTFIAEGFGAHNCGFQCQEKVLDEFRNSKPWQPGKKINAGHAVYVAGYDYSGVEVLTWGTIQQGTWAWWDEHVDECYALLPPEAKVEGFTTGFDFARLKKDLSEVAIV